MANELPEQLTTAQLARVEYVAHELWAADTRAAMKSYFARERAKPDNDPTLPLWVFPGPKFWHEVAEDVQDEYRAKAREAIGRGER